MDVNNNPYFIIEDLPSDVDENILIKYFQDKLNVTAVDAKSGKIFYDHKSDLTILEDLEDQVIPNTNIKLKFSFTADNTGSLSGIVPNVYKDFHEDDLIQYTMDYHTHALSQFVKAPGENSLKFTDQDITEKQRGVIKHILSKVGANILSGSGIMNVSLPINIFDERSLLEVFAHQCRLAPYFLEKAGVEEHPIEKLKLTTAWAVSRFHLSVTQLKPFNPIWGETFQCKVGDTNLYLEQTSHHPPIYHFLHYGKNFKSYGYQEPNASTGPNSVTAKTKGIHIVEFPDGTKHKVFPATLLLGGTLIGERLLAIVDKFYIVDEVNDYIAYIEMNPDDRGSFGKLFTKKKSFPDFFKGCITRLSHTTYKDGNYTLNKNHTPFVNISGEWTKNCLFDDDVYWDYNETKHFDLKRTKFTLPSDSTLRMDSLLLKKGREEDAAKAKADMEELQRKDRKLRASNKFK